jgi:hypothetical protein
MEMRSMDENNGMVITNGDGYTPTPAEEKLLKILLNPEFHGESRRQQCQQAGVSHQTLYKALKKPSFNKLLKDMSLSMIQEYAAPLIQRGIKEALRGNYPFWKTVMEMSGMYRPEQGIDVKANVGLTFEQLLKKALESGDNDTSDNNQNQEKYY